MATTPFNAATAAYGNASRLINQAAKPTTDLSAAAGGTGGNFAQMLAIFLIPTALCFAFGEAVRDRRQGQAILWAMSAIFVALKPVRPKIRIAASMIACR